MHRHSWRVGCNKSSREAEARTAEEIESGKIREGFHVYMSEEDAKQELEGRMSPAFSSHVMKIECDARDFVGAGRVEGTSRKCSVFTYAKLFDDESERIKKLQNSRGMQRNGY